MARVLFRNVRAKRRRNPIEELNKVALAELGVAMDQTKTALVKSHEIVVADWDHQPGFAARKFITPELLSVTVFPTGEHKKIWIFVDRGTKPHEIRPKRARKLKFPSGKYVPKTLPRPARTVSGGGKTVGGDGPIFADVVKHPGSEGRNFTKEIAEDIEPDFKRVTENAFRRINRRIQE